MLTARLQNRMARIPNEEHDLELVRTLVFVPFGLTLERFAHAEIARGRTPDFRVLLDKKIVAYCEVKSPRDDWLDEQIDVARPDQIVGGLRNDPTFNRLARHIEKAASQFSAVNSDHLIPNILVFVNHDENSDYSDLRETLTGNFFAEDGRRHPTMTHISQGRIGKAKLQIDIFSWIDTKTKRIQGHVINKVSAHVDVIRALLNIDMLKIEH